MMDQQHITHDDLALYALQALSMEESQIAREHLARCAECRGELARLEGGLAALAMSVEQQPLPPGARERFMQKIAEEPGTSAAGRGGADVVPIRRERRLGAAGWLGWIAAAAMLVVAVGLGMEISHLRSALDERNGRLEALQAARSREAKVAELLSSPRARKVVLTTPKAAPAPTGRAVYQASRGELIFQASNLAKIPSEKTYELWIIPANGSAPIPAGLFRPDEAGNGAVILPEIPSGVEAKAFGVTMENAAGSKTPTAPILLAGTVPATGE
jgi:anti-sigma-K factor RskA